MPADLVFFLHPLPAGELLPPQVELDPFESAKLDVLAYPVEVADLLEAYDAAHASLVLPPALFGDIGLFAGPCCNPFPLDKPCYCPLQEVPPREMGAAFPNQLVRAMEPSEAFDAATVAAALARFPAPFQALLAPHAQAAKPTSKE